VEGNYIELPHTQGTERVMENLTTSVNGHEVVTKASEASGPIEQAEKHRAKVRALIRREQTVGRRSARLESGRHLNVAA
jgi:hypothetical protein